MTLAISAVRASVGWRIGFDDVVVEFDAASRRFWVDAANDPVVFCQVVEEAADHNSFVAEDEAEVGASLHARVFLEYGFGEVVGGA